MSPLTNAFRVSNCLIDKMESEDDSKRWDPTLELTTTSPYVYHSRLLSQLSTTNTQGMEWDGVGKVSPFGWEHCICLIIMEQQIGKERVPGREREGGGS